LSEKTHFYDFFYRNLTVIKPVFWGYKIHESGGICCKFFKKPDFGFSILNPMIRGEFDQNSVKKREKKTGFAF